MIKARGPWRTAGPRRTRHPGLRRLVQQPPGDSPKPAATFRPQNWRTPTTVTMTASRRPASHNTESPPDSPGRLTTPEPADPTPDTTATPRTPAPNNSGHPPQRAKPPQPHPPTPSQPPKRQERQAQNHAHPTTRKPQKQTRPWQTHRAAWGWIRPLLIGSSLEGTGLRGREIQDVFT